MAPSGNNYGIKVVRVFWVLATININYYYYYYYYCKISDSRLSACQSARLLWNGGLIETLAEASEDEDELVVLVVVVTTFFFLAGPTAYTTTKATHNRKRWKFFITIK